MTDIILEVVKLILMLTVLIFFRYIIPWAKEMLGDIRYSRIERELTKLVYAIQERYGESKTGAERRAIVTEKIKEFLIMKNISLTDEQIRDFIDAVVKAMKIAEEAGIKIDATDDISDDMLDSAQ